MTKTASWILQKIFMLSINGALRKIKMILPEFVRHPLQGMFGLNRLNEIFMQFGQKYPWMQLIRNTCTVFQLAKQRKRQSVQYSNKNVKLLEGPPGIEKDKSDAALARKKIFWHPWQGMCGLNGLDELLIRNILCPIKINQVLEINKKIQGFVSNSVSMP